MNTIKDLPLNEAEGTVNGNTTRPSQEAFCSLEQSKGISRKTKAHDTLPRCSSFSLVLFRWCFNRDAQTISGDSYCFLSSATCSTRFYYQEVFKSVILSHSLYCCNPLSVAFFISAQPNFSPHPPQLILFIVVPPSVQERRRTEFSFISRTQSSWCDSKSIVSTLRCEAQYLKIRIAIWQK